MLAFTSPESRNRQYIDPDEPVNPVTSEVLESLVPPPIRGRVRRRGRDLIRRARWRRGQSATTIGDREQRPPCNEHGCCRDPSGDIDGLDARTPHQHGPLSEERILSAAGSHRLGACKCGRTSTWPRPRRLCRATDLRGWNLVDHAMRLVSAQFSTYSVLHPWESPEAAFRRGRGFCTQYNGALAIILLELKLQAWLVYAPRVRFDDQPDWALGHKWVRVRIDGDVRDACARSLHNAAGRVHFEPTDRVRRLNRSTRFITTTGSFCTAMADIVRARLHGRPRPEWVEHPRDPPSHGPGQHTRTH